MTSAAYSQFYEEQEIKYIYRTIVKSLHPDNNVGYKVTFEDMEMLHKANEYYKSGDYKKLYSIYEYVNNKKTSSKQEETKKTSDAYYKREVAETMMDYFIMNGCEVIDKRDKGGCLWVVGSQGEIGDIVRACCREFHAGGKYAMNGGRATGYRTAWFTRCSR